MLSFKNSNVYLNGKKIIKTNLGINKGKFVSKVDKDAITLNSKYFIVPGFIEEHIHGANKSDTMYATEKDLSNIASSLPSDGVTSFCPTTMTMSKTSIIKALKCIANKKHNDNEAKIVGINVEGPFISEAFKGAQDSKYILKPNVKDLKDFIKASNNMIKIITVAPENCSDAFYKCLRDNKITGSCGHSNAKYDDVKNGISKGINCITHTYNAQSKFHHRDIGVVGASLLHNDIYSELILDFIHVSKPAAQLLFKNKDKDKIVLISDSMEARYMPNGNYELGGQKVIVKDGLATLENGTIAGSVLRLNYALKHAKEISNFTFEEIIDLVTKNPAKNLKIDNKVGYIKFNRDADFAIIDKDFNVYQTYVNGKLVYSKKGFKF